MFNATLREGNLNSGAKSFRVNSPDVTAEDFKSEILAVDLKTGTYYSLRGAAVPLWRLLEEGVPLEKAVEWLAGAHGLPVTEMGAELIPFADRLVEAGLLVSREDVAGPEGAPGWLAELSRFEAPVLETYTEMQDLLMLDPIHDVDSSGWPQVAPAETAQPGITQGQG